MTEQERAREWMRLTHNYAVHCLAIEKLRRDLAQRERLRDEVMAEMVRHDSPDNGTGGR